MGTKTTIVGSGLSIQRYPVKSMQGEEIDGVELTERGVFYEPSRNIIRSKVSPLLLERYFRRSLEFMQLYFVKEEFPRVISSAYSMSPFE